MKQKRNFYIYVYLNPLVEGNFVYPDIGLVTEYEPFYVGKGSKIRMYNHISEAKNKNKTAKHKLILKIIDSGFDLRDYIIKLKDNMPEDEAYLLETKAIKSIGRKIIDKSNPLLNVHHGGAGGKLKPHKYSPEDELEIVKEYLNGASTVTLGKKYKVSHKTVRNILDREGIQPRSNSFYSAIPDETINYIKTLHDGGMSRKEISTHTKVNQSRVSSILKGAKRLRACDKRLEHNKENIIKDYENRMSVEAIVRKYKVPKAATAKLLRSRGIIRDHNWDEQLLSQIRTKYTEGLTAGAIGDLLRLNAKRVRNYLYDVYGRPECTPKPKKEPKPKLIDLYGDEIVKLYLEGANAESIAAKFGISSSSVHVILAKKNTPMRPLMCKFALTKEQEAVAVTRYLAGESALSISKDFNVGGGVVVDAVRRNGHVVRNRQNNTTNNPL